MMGILLLFLALGTLQHNVLQNAGFEAAEATKGWQVAADKRNAGITIQSDEKHHKEGHRSLLISASHSAEISISQDLFLPVGTLWKASVWVKTEALAGRTTDEPGGQIRIETPPGDQGTSAPSSTNQDWTKQEVLFRTPSPGRVTVRLIGLERATGKVWFDDVRLDPVDEPTDSVEEVSISNQRLSNRPIDLKQGGQFIEPLCRLTPSMIAQQVDSTSFEDEPAWKPSYKREIDKPYRPWYPDGAVHLAKYSLDTEDPYNGKRSEKIKLPVAHAQAGISQDGFYLEAEHNYRLRLHARSDGNVKLVASLHGEGGVIAGPVSLGETAATWQGAEAVLHATRSAQNATLTIQFTGPGTIWLDRIYLIDESAVLGIWRPDVVAALKAMNPGVIRFGGSTLEVFEWDKCIGNWDERVPYVTNPWGGLDPNFIGVEEIIQLCHHIGAEPLICVRWTGKKPEDAAAEVEYFNGSSSTRWGKVRARNGHPEPYHVKYWQIGNEIGGARYDASIRAFAEAMRRADPSVKILSSYPSADTLKMGGGYLDYLCPHHYQCDNLAREEKDFKFLRDQISRYAAGRDVRVAVTEWNTTAGEMGLTRGMLLTLGNALGCSRYQNLMHRYCNLVEIAIRSNLSDSFGSGVIQPGPGWLYLAPTYYSQQLYQRAAGTYPVQISRSAALPVQLQEPDLSATLSEDGKTLRLYAVNSTSGERLLRFRLNGFAAAVGGHVFVLTDRDEALDSEAMNSHDDPSRIGVSSGPAPIHGAEFEYKFEPFSITLLELEMEK